MSYTTPIIPDLVQDNTPIIFGTSAGAALEGLALYKISFVSRQWNVYAALMAVTLRNLPSWSDVESEVARTNILWVLDAFRHKVLKSHLMEMTCKYGNQLLLKIVMRRGCRNWDEGGYGASVGGHANILAYMKNRGAADIKRYVYGACLGNHTELAISLITDFGDGHKRHAQRKIRDRLEQGLIGACLGGHPHLVELLITPGGISKEPMFAHAAASNWGDGLSAACKGGHITLVQLMIDRGARNYNNSMIDAFGMSATVDASHMEIIRLLIEYGANNWAQGLCHACYAGNTELALMMIQYGAFDVANFNTGLKSACSNNALETVRLMLTYGATNFDECLRQSAGIRRTSIEIVQLLINAGAKDFESALISACVNGRIDVAKLMIAYGASNWELARKRASGYGQNDIVKLINQHDPQYKVL